MAAGYDCLIIDWPGQGRSGQLGAHQLIVHLDHFSAYYDALDEVLAEAGWQAERFVFGHSLGGHLALNIARSSPHLSGRLVFICANDCAQSPAGLADPHLGGLAGPFRLSLSGAAFCHNAQS